MRTPNDSKWPPNMSDFDEQIAKTVKMVNERRTIFTVNIDLSTLTKYQIREYMRKLILEYKKRKHMVD